MTQSPSTREKLGVVGFLSLLVMISLATGFVLGVMCSQPLPETMR